MERKGYTLMIFWVFFWLVVEWIVAYLLGPKFLFVKEANVSRVFHSGIFIGIFSLIAIALFSIIYTMPLYAYVSKKNRVDRRLIVKKTFDFPVYMSIYSFIITGVIPMAYLYLKFEANLTDDSIYPFILWVFASSVAYSMIILAGLDLFSTYIAESLKIIRRERFGFFKRSLKYELPTGVIATVLF